MPFERERYSSDFRWEDTEIRLDEHGVEPIMPNQRTETSNIDQARINAAALKYLPALVKRWLPGGQMRGRKWVAKNPRRMDHHAGSFKVDLGTGAWRDYATAEGGRDVISLAAFLAKISHEKAAVNLAKMLEHS